MSAVAVSVRSRRVSTNLAAGAPSTTPWSKLTVRGSMGLTTTLPSRTTGRSTTPPTVAITVSGGMGIAQPPP